MSKTEILEELPKLTREEREEIRTKLAELECDGWDDEGMLTDAQKREIEPRVAEHKRNPDAAIPWVQVKADMQKRFGL